MRTYGRLWLDNDHWHLDAEPHVAMMAKRVFPRIGRGSQGVLRIKHTDAVARDLDWFLQRFTLEVLDRETLDAASRRHVDHILTLNRIVGGDYQPPDCSGMAVQPRSYQLVAAELHRRQQYLLNCDELGLGKSCEAIISFTDRRCLPAVVVAQTHLAKQWTRQIEKFLPELTTHVVKQTSLYPLPKFFGNGPDVVIVSYHKLHAWATTLAEYASSVVFDEIQELRRDRSEKYKAAEYLAGAMRYTMGLSATPIYNYGGEIFNVVNVLRPGLLGTRDEFATEWCEGYAGKERLRDPVAFGSYLREQHIMLRRTRSEVGRELPPVQRIVQPVDSDARVLDEAADAASELARIILGREKQARGEAMQAAGEFDNLMRQATGVAKAPHVAAFVRLLVESGESVVLFGWHRAVYEIWLSKLRDLQPALYTGSESPQQKAAAVEAFVAGKTRLLVMSLRSGVGVDGLQERCRTAVFGELDWSPGVIDQCIGRLARDGQRDPVAAYLMLADDGADPVMAETLGLKREQSEGVIDLGSGELEKLDRNDDGIRRLAERYLQKQPPATKAS